MYQKIIVKPILTEKMAILQERENKFAFLVTKGANKPQIKKAIEEKFDVKVSKIATINGLGKNKQMTIRSGGRVIRTQGKRSNWKKAIVTLNDGFTIDLVRGETAN
ncbi:MAG: 50S ribosomal protein L23 [Candidatus Neomarinimicrobiota bacterium]|jgi:large subunit ribosomal protein L23|uniref:50S ribosomal protein L23 n=1 Tax=marine metagenome TaxID=408172 RepID=A0A382EZ35_9ZZZZ|nr:50S ribosomal protein L23 [Candidatus Neomarinimicrobiota bacterium]